MSKSNKKSLGRVLKQVLLLALPLLLEHIKKRRVKAGGGAVANDASAPPFKPKRTAESKSRKPRASGQVKVSPKASPIAELFAQRRSDVIITDTGVVVHVLPDDNEGSRHQRLLVEVDRSDVTVKIAHNIDLAPRVPARKGDRIKFHGEYEWNELGGALHWTHHDPQQWREGGWIEHEGKRYE